MPGAAPAVTLPMKCGVSVFTSCLTTAGVSFVVAWRLPLLVRTKLAGAGGAPTMKDELENPGVSGGSSCSSPPAADASEDGIVRIGRC